MQIIMQLDLGSKILAGLFSLFVALASGLLVYNFFEIRSYSVSEELPVLVAGLVSVISGLAYYWLLQRMAPAWKSLIPLHKWMLLGVSALLGVYLMATTTGLKVAPETVALLTPDRTLEIHVPANQDPDVQVILYYLSTEAGDVSFDEVKYHGWRKTDAEAGLRQSGSWLVLTDLADNLIRWTGKPGDKAQLAFARSPQSGVVEVSWNDATETIDLADDKEGRFFYNTQFYVPLVASGKAVLLVSYLAFFAWMLSVCLYLWSERKKLRLLLVDSIHPVSYSVGQRRPGKQRGGRKINQIWGWLLVLMLAALVPRILHLGQGVVAVDEMHQLLAAKDLMNGASLTEVYQRGLYMVTLPVTGFMNAFGIQLWAAKLPGILFNVLAIIPLFLIMDKVNRQAAIFSCLLYAFSPWIIGMSRFVREYAYEPFYFYWIVLGMTAVIERLPNGFVINRDWKAITDWRFVSLLLALLLALIYTVFVDPFSTFQIIGLTYVVFGLFLLSRLELANKSNRLFLGLGALASTILAFLYLRANPAFSIIPDPDFYPLFLFFPNPAGQIYFDRPAVLFALALIVSIVWSAALLRRNFIPAFIFVIFVTSAVFLTAFWGRFNAARYFISLQFWFLPLLGIGFYGLWQLAQDLIKARPAAVWTAAILILGLSVNPGRILEPAKIPEPPDSGFAQVVGYSLYNMQPVESMLLNEAKPGDILISEQYGYATYASWRGIPQFEIIPISTHLADDSRAEELRHLVYERVESNDSGWIVLRYWWQWNALPRTPVQIGNKTLEYLGENAWQYIWHWSPTTELQH